MIIYHAKKVTVTLSEKQYVQLAHFWQKSEKLHRTARIQNAVNYIQGSNEINAWHII
jgi:hypothetical protein